MASSVTEGSSIYGEEESIVCDMVDTEDDEHADFISNDKPKSYITTRKNLFRHQF